MEGPSGIHSDPLSSHLQKQEQEEGWRGIRGGAEVVGVFKEDKARDCEN